MKRPVWVNINNFKDDFFIFFPVSLDFVIFKFIKLLIKYHFVIFMTFVCCIRPLYEYHLLLSYFYSPLCKKCRRSKDPEPVDILAGNRASSPNGLGARGSQNHILFGLRLSLLGKLAMFSSSNWPSKSSNGKISFNGIRVIGLNSLTQIQRFVEWKIWLKLRNRDDLKLLTFRAFYLNYS